MKYFPKDFVDYPNYERVEVQLYNGETQEYWRPIRPINFQFESWRFRLKNAFYVLIGRYDVLDWNDLPKNMQNKR